MTTQTEAVETGLAGCSVEDYSGRADVLFAPGLGGIEDIRRAVSSVDQPVSALA